MGDQMVQSPLLGNANGAAFPAMGNPNMYLVLSPSLHPNLERGGLGPWV